MNPSIYILSQIVNRYDLMVACKEIGEGSRHEPSLLGDVRFDPITTASAYDVKLEARKVNNDQLLKLLRRYSKRQSSIDIPSSTKPLSSNFLKDEVM